MAITFPLNLESAPITIEDVEQLLLIGSEVNELIRKISHQQRYQKKQSDAQTQDAIFPEFPMPAVYPSEEDLIDARQKWWFSHLRPHVGPARSRSLARSGMTPSQFLALDENQRMETIRLMKNIGRAVFSVIVGYLEQERKRRNIVLPNK